MHRSDESTTAAERSRWLAELAVAIRDAQRLARVLGVDDDRGPASDLYVRLESVRLEVEALRRGSWAPRPTEIDPRWIKPFPWERRHRHWRSEN